MKNELQHSNQPKKTEEINEIQEQTMNKDGLPNAGRTRFREAKKVLTH